MSKNKSWRDTDRMRESNNSVGGGRFRIHTPTGSRGYKNDLNKLFDKGEMPDRFKSMLNEVGSSSAEGAERQKMLREARQAEASEEFFAICSDFIQKYELPDDQQLLMRMLDHPDESVVQKALEQLLDLDGRRPLQKRRLLAARLQTLEQVATQERTHELVKLLGERL